MFKLFFSLLYVCFIYQAVFPPSVFLSADICNVDSFPSFDCRINPKDRKNAHKNKENYLGQELPRKKSQRFLLITGCSRSGTTFIADALSLCGLDIGHELLGKDGCSSWFMCIDNALAPWKDRPTAQNFEFEHVFHQVRHPLEVISSVYATEHFMAVKFFVANIPEIDLSDSHLVKCAKFWYYWNLYAEKKAEWRYQIEQIEEVWEEMGQRLGITLDKEALKKVSAKSNHRDRKVQFSWLELSQQLPADLFMKIQDMAIRYGYVVD